MTLTQFIPKTLLFCCLSSTAFGLEIDGFTQQKNERFKNDASFIGSGFDLSGIGRDNNGRWVTMISSTVFLSAAHHSPSGLVSFYDNNNPLSTAATRNIVSGTNLGTSDLYIGHLDAPVSPNIKHYNFATTTTGLGSSIVYQAGIPDVDKSIDSGFPNTLNMVVGTNNLTTAKTVTRSDGTGYTLWTAINDSSDTANEAIVQSGDSGSPLFVVDGSNNITILGTAWYKGLLVSVTKGNRDASVYNFTGDHTAEINDYIARQVPEPSSTLLVGITLTLSACVRKRS